MLYRLVFLIAISLVQAVVRHNETGGLWLDHVSVATSTDLLLPPVSLRLPNGRVCGLLGPSGSGKSTLMTAILAGTHAGAIRLATGTLRRGSVVRYDERGLWQSLESAQVAVLQQQDDFFPHLTVAETLQLAAFLEVPHVTAASRSVLVETLLERLGLAHVANRQVGTGTVGGSRLSGGERRRLSVALELVTEKHLVLADEPTTGLDVALSMRIVRLIRELAVAGDIPCVISLHQPRSAIWNDLLDDCILLAPGGRVCFAGPRVDALDYFRRLGYPIPPQTNPAEFLVDLVSVDPENQTQAAMDRARIAHLAKAFAEYQARQEARDLAGAVAPPLLQLEEIYEPISLRMILQTFWDRIPRFFALLRRSVRQNVRNRSVNLFRLFASAGNAYLLAQIFPTVVRGPAVYANSIADRVALLSFGAINMCMMAYMKTVELFSKERSVVRREQMRDQYSMLEYLLAKVVAELPMDASFSAVFTTVLKATTGLRISWPQLTAVFSVLTMAGASLGLALGSWTPSDQMATTVGIPLMVILMVVGVINPSGVDPNKGRPKIVQWLQQFSPFAFGIEALCLGEYPGMEFARPRSGWFGWLRRVSSLPRMGGLALVRNGDQVIEALGLSGHSYTVAMHHLALLTAGNLLLSWLGLMYQQSQRSRRKTRAKESRSSVPPVETIPVVNQVRFPV